MLRPYLRPINVKSSRVPPQVLFSGKSSTTGAHAITNDVITDGPTTNSPNDATTNDVIANDVIANDAAAYDVAASCYDVITSHDGTLLTKSRKLFHVLHLFRFVEDSTSIIVLSSK